LSLLELKSFIKNVKPFDNLSEYELNELSNGLDIVYFKENQTVLKNDQKPESLYFIIKGVIQESDDGEIISVYTSNEYFDPISLIEGREKHTFIAIQESICYALSRDIFLKIMYQNEKFERYFFTSIADKLNTSNQNEQKKKLLDFATSKVEDAYLQKPIYIDETETIHNTVKLLVENNIQAILVRRSDGEIGIVTDSSFVKKVTFRRMDLDGPVSMITTYGLKSIELTDFLFNAQLKMAKYNLKRLIVKDKGEIVGILDMVSLSSYFASHTHSTSMLIEDAITVDELKEASAKFIRTIRSLYEKGVKVRYISKLISQLNEKLFAKLFKLTAPQELFENSCLVIMGSEGRGEQVLRTDQDNALIISDTCSLVQEEIENFTQDFTAYLVEFGYPLCDGNIMLSNSYWCKKVNEFKDTISNWIHEPNEEKYMNLAIFYDAKAVVGDKELLYKLKDFMYKICEHTPSFYPFFAKPTLMFETPLSFFSDFIVDKDQHKNELDIKKGAIFAIVHGVRSLAIEKNIYETNTIERLKKLNDLDIIDKELATELIESFNFLLTLRLRFRLEKIDQRIELDNYINPNKLTMLERDLLKDSLKIVNKFKKLITYHYKLNSY
jgi:CBS domain-containing protein